MNDKTKEKSPIAKSPLVIVSAAALLPILFYIYLGISYQIHPQSGAEYGFMLAYPSAALASVILFINGIILLVRAIRRRKQTKKIRIIAACIGVLFLIPGGWVAWSNLKYELVKLNARQAITKEAALSLVKECKAEHLYRKDGYSGVDKTPHKLVGQIYLKKSAQSSVEKESYFYSYRTFDASYFDDVLKAAKDVQSKCGYVAYDDDTRENLPTQYSWATQDEAKDMIKSCSVPTIYTKEKWDSVTLGQVVNPGDSGRGVFMSVNPAANGYTTFIYLGSANDQTKKSILDFADQERKRCPWGRPEVQDSPAN